MLKDDTGRATRPHASVDRTPWLAVAGVAVVLLVLIAAQVLAATLDFAGPLTSLLHDYIGTPKSATVPWAGLVLALVGISARRRVMVLAAAVGIDVCWLTVRALTDGRLTVGNGPTIALTGLAVVAVVRWSGTERATALRAVAFGALLILATKIGDTWLTLTALTRPQVLDEYVLLADRALGNPSWVAGQLLDELGPVVSGVLHWVYIELPVAAIVVAIWQLRGAVSGVWPSHHLIRTFLLIGLLGPLGYMLFPVVGPVLAFGYEGHGAQLGDYWPNVVPSLNYRPQMLRFDDITPRNCMPSLHTAWALAIFLHTRTGPRLLRWGGAFWLVGTLAATLGFGGHYGVDLVAGAVFCLTIESALRDPERGWDLRRWQLVGGGTATFAALLLSYRYLAVQMSQYPVIFGALLLTTLTVISVAFHNTWFSAKVLASAVR